MRVRHLLVFLLSISVSFAQGYDTSGDEEFIRSIPKKPQSKGLATAVYPESYDLTKYMPPIGDQEGSGSCLAWTLSYYSMSILYNKHFDIVDRTAKFALAFDPYYVYNSRFATTTLKNSYAGMEWVGLLLLDI